MDTLDRFLEAQEKSYTLALSEIRNGRKRSHWMWYIFPQIAGLGSSSTAQFYAIRDIPEARLYLKHHILGKRLIEISNALLDVKDRTAQQVFGSPDNLKLRSCMTLFASLNPTDPVFQEVLDKYFDGGKDHRSLDLIRKLPADGSTER